MKSTMCTLALALGLCAATSALADPFVLVVRESPDEFAKRERKDASGAAYWTAYAAYGDALRAANVLRGGSPLGHALYTVRVINGMANASRPKPADRLVLGGFFLIDVSDLATANEWASRAPAALSGRVDVHAVPASPAMPK